MQATDRMKDRINPQAIQATPALATMRQVTRSYQRPVTNTHANILFLGLSNSIIGIMTPMPQYSDEDCNDLVT